MVANSLVKLSQFFMVLVSFLPSTQFTSSPNNDSILLLFAWNLESRVKVA